MEQTADGEWNVSSPFISTSTTMKHIVQILHKIHHSKFICYCWYSLLLKWEKFRFKTGLQSEISICAENFRRSCSNASVRVLVQNWHTTLQQKHGFSQARLPHSTGGSWISSNCSLDQRSLSIDALPDREWVGWKWMVHKILWFNCQITQKQSSWWNAIIISLTYQSPSYVNEVSDMLAVRVLSYYSLVAVWSASSVSYRR